MQSTMQRLLRRRQGISYALRTVTVLLQYREEIKMAYYTAVITEEKELLAEIKEYGGEMQYGKL